MYGDTYVRRYVCQYISISVLSSITHKVAHSHTSSSSSLSVLMVFRTGAKGPGKSMLPANDRWEDRDRRQRTQAASYRTKTSVSGEIRLSGQRRTRHLGRTIRRGEYAWRPRRGPSARSNQGERHAGSNKPRRRRPFSRGQSRLHTKGIRPPNGALRNTRARQQAEARTSHPRACRSLRHRYHLHRVAPSAQRTQEASEADCGINV